MGFFSGKKKEPPPRRLYAQNVPITEKAVEETQTNKSSSVIQTTGMENEGRSVKQERLHQAPQNQELKLCENQEEEKWDAYCEVLDQFMETKQLSFERGS